MPTPAPEALVRLAGLDRGDYSDVLDSAAGWSAEQWARATFEGAPAVLRIAIRLGWRVELGMRLAPLSTPGCVFGWPIVADGPGFVVLGVHAALLGDARLVFWVADGRAAVATVLAFDRPWAARAWTVIGVVHRVIMRYLVRRAGRRRSGQ